MSGVTTIQRKIASTDFGSRTLPWLNIDVAFNTISKTSTATTDGPSAAMAKSLIPIESRISKGWNRNPVVTSKSRSA